MSQRRATPPVSEAAARVDAIAEWRSPLTAITGAYLAFETLSGIAVWLLPFSRFNQVALLGHTLVGWLVLPALFWYLARHWWVRRRGRLNHHQLLGYATLALLLPCVASGAVLTVQALTGPRLAPGWDLTHLLTGIGVPLFCVVHFATLVVRPVAGAASKVSLSAARGVFYARSMLGAAALLIACGGLGLTYGDDASSRPFPDDYEWRFGADRPFAPSLARVEREGWTEHLASDALAAVTPRTQLALAAAFAGPAEPGVGIFETLREAASTAGASDEERRALEAALARAADRVRAEGALAPASLAGSARCGTSGCHAGIYQEWLPSAHRYSSLDDMFQRVQALMAEETSPEHTRYCAGCHDPISLFSGSKNSGNVTLSAEGSDEGSSCLVCHSIVQTDVQGNGDYTLRPPERYLLEQRDGDVSRVISDFLIRADPTRHIESYSRPLYKTAAFCAACHKQYMDKEVNTDIGKVQGQNQYDSWKNSRWHHPDDPARDISCRECHMPLVQSDDPARGDMTDRNRTPQDGKHRSHRMLASNQYIPLLHDLPGAREHVALTEQWLRGEIEIPEIADKWTEGPVVRLEIEAPESVTAGEVVSVRVVLINNKTGHDFPTGPLDMIESWVEVVVTASDGREVFRAGRLDDDARVTGSPILYKADGFDREGGLIDRHNLWDLVGASYKRSLYPGVTDAAELQFQCPSMARGRVLPRDEKLPPGRRVDELVFRAEDVEASDDLTVQAALYYRKANPDFLQRVYGADSAIESPVTRMSSATTRIRVLPRE